MQLYFLRNDFEYDEGQVYRFTNELINLIVNNGFAIAVAGGLVIFLIAP